MRIAKNSEITASSSTGFEDAVRKGIKRFSKTVDNVEGAWVKEQKAVVVDGEVSEYRVTMIVTFIIKD
ncbi:MAG: dodecin family protein [Gammaproteobacteria bacterium]|nr:dodecin family protein [Gammaproteobacteria bacterium]